MNKMPQTSKERADELLKTLEIKEDDINRMITAASINYKEFLDKPDEDTFNRMTIADLSINAIVDRIHAMGPEQIVEETKKSEFSALVIEVIGLFAMLGVKMGYCHDKQD